MPARHQGREEARVEPPRMRRLRLRQARYARYRAAQAEQEGDAQQKAYWSQAVTWAGGAPVQPWLEGKEPCGW